MTIAIYYHYSYYNYSKFYPKEFYSEEDLVGVNLVLNFHWTAENIGHQADAFMHGRWKRRSR